MQPFLVLGQVCFVASGVCLTERNKKKEKETDEDRHTAVRKRRLTKAPLTLLLEMQTVVWVFALGLGANEAHWSDRWGFNSEKELNYRPGKHQLGRVTRRPFIWARHPPVQLFLCLTCHLGLPLFRLRVLAPQSVNLLFPPYFNLPILRFFSPENPFELTGFISFSHFEPPGY